MVILVSLYNNGHYKAPAFAGAFIFNIITRSKKKGPLETGAL